MRILRAADHRRMPWKNGGGVTTEIAVFPEGAGLDEFEWRLSMANVASDGPFSLFADVDRTLAVLEGEGIVLSVEGRADVTLARTSPPFAFAADRQCAARLITGPILDLNIMTRRDRFAHRLELVGEGRSMTRSGAALTIAFCAVGSASISTRDERATLGTHDAAICDGGCRVESREGAEIFVVTLERR